MAATAWGFNDAGANSSVPYIIEQGWGAYLGLGVAAIYFARRHLAAAFRRAFLRGHHSPHPLTATDSGWGLDADEPMTYRAAYLGLFFSFAALVAFGWALGLSWVIAVVYFGLFFLAVLAFTRIRAEAGLPWGFGPWLMAHDALPDLGGTTAFTPSELTAFALLRWSDTDWRCLSQPAQLEAMKAADAAHFSRPDRRRMTGLMLAAILAGTLSAWGACLFYYYHYGAASAHVEPWRIWNGRAPFDRLHSQLGVPRPMDAGRLGVSSAGRRRSRCSVTCGCVSPGGP